MNANQSPNTSSETSEPGLSMFDPAPAPYLSPEYARMIANPEVFEAEQKRAMSIVVGLTRGIFAIEAVNTAERKAAEEKRAAASAGK